MKKIRWRRIVNLVRPEAKRNTYLYRHYEWAQQCAPTGSFGLDMASAKSFEALMNMDNCHKTLLRLPLVIRKQFASQKWSQELCEELGKLDFDEVEE